MRERAFNWLLIAAMLLVLAGLLTVIWGAPPATCLKLIGTGAVFIAAAFFIALAEASNPSDPKQPKSRTGEWDGYHDGFGPLG